MPWEFGIAMTAVISLVVTVLTNLIIMKHTLKRVDENVVIQGAGIQHVVVATETLAATTKDAHRTNEDWLKDVKDRMDKVKEDMSFIKGRINGKGA